MKNLVVAQNLISISMRKNCGIGIGNSFDVQYLAKEKHRFIAAQRGQKRGKQANI